MPTISVQDSLQYFYTDSGSPNKECYSTLIILHGHTFHSGTFQRFMPVAFSKSIRVICINRRHYPGTTPFNKVEKAILTSGEANEKEKLVENIGKDLVLAIVGLIQECMIPEAGGITLTGWSQGILSLLALVSVINELDETVKGTLLKYVTGILLWDPPSLALGIPLHPDGYLPFGDPNIPPESLGAAFGDWVSSYFKNGDFAKIGVSEINFKIADVDRISTVQKMSSEELSTVIDFSMDTEYETAMVKTSFFPITDKITRKALFGLEIRSAWKNAEFFFLYGDCSPWVFTYAFCIIAKYAEASPFEIKFRSMPESNHLPMWEQPEECVAVLEDFLKLNDANRGK